MSKATQALAQYRENPISVKTLADRWVDGTQEKRNPRVYGFWVL